MVSSENGLLTQFTAIDPFVKQTSKESVCSITKYRSLCSSSSSCSSSVNSKISLNGQPITITVDPLHVLSSVSCELDTPEPRYILAGEDGIREVISELVQLPQNADTPLYAVDLGMVYKKFCEWTSLMPRVKPFYAVKCNPNRAVVRTLASCGAGFDCASKAEIELCLEVGAPIENIIFANPCKAAPQLRYAKSVNACTMTFDNVDELYKIQKLYPDAELVLRLYTDDAHSTCPLGSKFGAHEDSIPELVRATMDLNLRLVGISFHVGSGCYDANAYVEAVRLARRAFDVAEGMGLKLSLLDLGGGFPGAVSPNEILFSEIAAALNPVLDELFDDSVQIIAEPGRYFVSAAFTLATPIVMKRVMDFEGREVSRDSLKESENFHGVNITSEDLKDAEIDSNDDSASLCSWESSSNSSLTNSNNVSCDSAPSTKNLTNVYYLNDSVYGSFKDSILLQERYTPTLLRQCSVVNSKPSRIMGNTGEEHDIINDNIQLPDLCVGDWFFFPNSGAYTVSLSSRFNGCGSHHFAYYWGVE